MTLLETARDQDRSSIEDHPREMLDVMLAAGREVQEWQRILNKTNDNIFGIILKHQRSFSILDHYPQGDVYDPESHAQWYYHAHDKSERPFEHGHFHTFLRGRGMADGIKPVPLPNYRPKDDPYDLVSHLIAVSMDSTGRPIGLFTTNRWVTGETWFTAHDVCSMLDGFDMNVDKPTWTINRWLTNMLRLFQPQIIDLLMLRDERILVHRSKQTNQVFWGKLMQNQQSSAPPSQSFECAGALEWKLEHQDRPIYEDRELEVTSQMPIDVDEQVLLLESRLEQAA